MDLDIYRSCSWREKREVLKVFWHRGSGATSKIVAAALQYGHYATIAIAVIVVELALVSAVALVNGRHFGWLAAGAEVLVLPALCLSVLRLRTLKVDSRNL